MEFGFGQEDDVRSGWRAAPRSGVTRSRADLQGSRATYRYRFVTSTA